METNIICYCFSNNFMRLLLQATETPHFTNYGLRLFNPSSLQDDFCYLQQPSVPNRWVSWSPRNLCSVVEKSTNLSGGKLLAEMGTHLSGGKNKGRQRKVPCLEDVVPLTHGCCAATSIAGNNLYNCSLILMKGRPLNHQLADHHLPSILILVSNAINLHNSRIRLGE